MAMFLINNRTRFTVVTPRARHVSTTREETKNHRWNSTKPKTHEDHLPEAKIPFIVHSWTEIKRQQRQKKSYSSQIFFVFPERLSPSLSALQTGLVFFSYGNNIYYSQCLSAYVCVCVSILFFFVVVVRIHAKSATNSGPNHGDDDHDDDDDDDDE